MVTSLLFMSFPVRVRPVFDEPDVMTDIFFEKGFRSIENVSIFNDYFVVAFPSRRHAEEFCAFFDGARIMGKVLSAVLERPAPEEPRRFSPRPGFDERKSPPLKSRTVAVRGYPSQFLSDRALWNDFWRAGYLKQVEIQKGIGYLQFDTEEDASRAVQMNNGMRIANSRITVEIISDRALNVPNILVPLQLCEKDDNCRF